MAKYQLLLPKMGESVAEATVIGWLKNPGDKIDADDAVVEIATDKVDSDVPSPVSGVLVEQLFQKDEVVQVGSPIAIIETEDAEEEPVVQEPAITPAQKKAAVQEPVIDLEQVPEPEATVDLPGLEQLAKVEAPAAKPVVQ